MEIKIIKNQQIWTDFFNQNGSLSFLQSWEWGELQKKLNYKTLRLGIYENNSLQAIAQVIKIRAKRGSFLFVPHGPITKIQTSKLKIKSFLKLLKNYLFLLGKKQNFSFIRIAPILENNPQTKELFKDIGFKPAPIYLHAERAWVKKLIKDNKEPKTENELLKEMRKNTRYLIRRAKRDGVKIDIRTDNKAIDDFYKIYRITSQREKFTPFSKDFIQKEFNEFKKNNNGLFLFSRFKNDYLSSALIVFTQSTAFYHQGASIHTKIPVSYLLQWQAIETAKKRSCQFYNFWGIFKKNRTPQSWKGLSFFKKGFGGYQIDYLPTQDYILSSKYYLSYLYDTWLMWRRGV